MKTYVEIINKIEVFEKESSEIKEKASLIIKEIESLSNKAEELSREKEQLMEAAIAPNENTALIDELKRENEELKKALEYMKKVAYVDEKFNTNNEVAFFERFYKNNEKCISVAFVDVKDMKIINQTFKDDIGDNVIRLTSESLKNMFGNDNVYRIRGAQFAIILKEGTSARIRSMLKIVKDELYNEHDIEVSYGYAMIEESIGREEAFKTAKNDAKNEKKYLAEVDNVKEITKASNEDKERKEPAEEKEIVVNPNIMSSIYDDLYSEAENIIEVDSTSIDVALEIMDMQNKKK